MQWKLEDLAGLICAKINDELLHFPEQIIIHAPSELEQKFIITSNDGKVFSIIVSELKM